MFTFENHFAMKAINVNLVSPVDKLKKKKCEKREKVALAELSKNISALV